MFDSKMNDINHVGKTSSRYLKLKICAFHISLDSEDTLKLEKQYLSLEDYDCIGFDLDHTLCRYNIGPMIRYQIHFMHQPTTIIIKTFL